MMTFITVERLAPDGLSKRVWRFMPWDSHGDFAIFLDGYSEQERQTKRHGWNAKIVNTPAKRIKMVYSRIDERQSELAVNEVPLPDDVAADAKQQFIATLVVKKWVRT